MPELLIGCGRQREKLILPAETEVWTSLWTSDINPRHEMVGDEHFTAWDLEKTPWPWDDNQFDEVHAYEVMEHLGRQGDYRALFSQFYEIWRILKPGGYFCGTSPSLDSRWLWGDPGHTRVICNETFTYLDQREYQMQVDGGSKVTPMTDYRFCWKGNLRRAVCKDAGGTFIYVLQAIKE